MPSEVISHLSILVFLVTHSHVWHPKLCWGLLKALSQEHMVQSPALVRCCITQDLSQAPCYSQQRWAQAEQNGRLAQVFGQSFRRITVIFRVQREQALSWPAGMGEDGERQRSWWDVRGEQTQFRLVISGLVLNVYLQSSSELTREISWGYNGDCKCCTNLFSP